MGSPYAFLANWRSHSRHTPGTEAQPRRHAGPQNRLRHIAWQCRHGDSRRASAFADSARPPAVRRHRFRRTQHSSEQVCLGLPLVAVRGTSLPHQRHDPTSLSRHSLP